VLKQLEMRRRDDEGFTLIELMVVVLILGILMAIAIPTFLSTTKSAKGVAAESNAVNAATSEVSNYSTATLFLSSTQGATLDPAIPWMSTAGTTNAATGKVLVVTSNYAAVGGSAGTYTGWANAAASNGNAMVIMSLASNSYCYAVFDDQSLATPEVGYIVWKNGCPGGATTTFPATFAVGTPQAGSASANVDQSATPSWGTGDLANGAASLYSSF
jgi:type IV pilus assembly protein PilA